MTQPSVMQLDGNDSGVVYDMKLNEIVQAHHTMFAGASAPVTPVADMLWQDKSVDPPYLKRRNSTNSAWDNMGQMSNQVYYGSITGHSATTDTLTTPRAIIISGAGTGSSSFNGSADANIVLTLANSGVAAGSYGNTTNVASVTVNSKGLITSVSNTPITFPVTSFNGRTGAISLTTTDVGNVIPRICSGTWELMYDITNNSPSQTAFLSPGVYTAYQTATVTFGGDTPRQIGGKVSFLIQTGPTPGMSSLTDIISHSTTPTDTGNIAYGAVPTLSAETGVRSLLWKFEDDPSPPTAIANHRLRVWQLKY